LILIDSAGIYHKEFSLWLKRVAFKNLARFKKIAYSTVLKNILYKLAREEDYNKASPVMKKTMQNLIESDLSDNLHSIKIPTTIIWGEDDTTTPLSDGILMNKEIKNSKMFVINNSRHSPQFTDAKKVADIIFANIR
jgi:pimeloyl-ACP methyl ester carboxylesterase